MFILSQKLKKLKLALKDWNKSVFGDVHARVDNVMAEVDEIQKHINDLGCNDDLMNHEKQAQL